MIDTRKPSVFIYGESRSAPGVEPVSVWTLLDCSSTVTEKQSADKTKRNHDIVMLQYKTEPSRA